MMGGDKTQTNRRVGQERKGEKRRGEEGRGVERGLEEDKSEIQNKKVVLFP